MTSALPSSLRLANQRKLLEQLLRFGAASRAELADATGMSRPTAGKIVDELIAAGALEEQDVELEPGRVGRPGRRVVLEGSVPRFVLVEVGVRRTAVAAVPLADGAPTWKSFATPRSAEGFLGKVAAAVADLELSRPWAFALSLPGVVDERSGASVYSPNLHFTAGTNLPERLGQRLGIPGCAVQEIRALALGQLARVPEHPNFLLVDSDDGLGAAVVIRGQLFEGALPMAGELGHTRVLGNERRCGCGATGCVETLAARPGLLASCPAADWNAAIASLSHTPPPGWLLETMEATGTVIAGALNVLGLGRVVLTGAFAELPPRAIDELRRAVVKGTLVARFGEIQIETAERYRARGMLWALVDRMLIPTMDWSKPCILSPG